MPVTAGDEQPWHKRIDKNRTGPRLSVLGKHRISM